MADEWIIFVDTNIFLDFYRFPGDSAKRQMKALERHKDRIIINEQIRMEFLKNRQNVILDAFRGIKKPVKTNFPQVLAESQPAKLMRKSEEQSIHRYGQLSERVQNFLSRPANYDPVFQAFNRIVKSSSKYNLKRDDEKRFTIRNRAKKRFVLGYPPRKSGDTSIGDSFNWEWIVECASNSDANQHVLIVSRDGDFGKLLGNTAYLNDWLRYEFKDRISKLRRIELTTKLTDALRRLDETVSEEDVKLEDDILTEASVSSKSGQVSDDDPEALKILEQYLRILGQEERDL